jgi:hypothetical protein
MVRPGAGGDGGLEIFGVNGGLMVGFFGNGELGIRSGGSECCFTSVDGRLAGVVIRRAGAIGEDFAGKFVLTAR